MFVALFYYQVVVAYFMGYERMKSMDAQCFVSSSKSHLNFMSVNAYDKDLTIETFLYNIDRLIKVCPKISYKVVECGGDYYYQALPMKEALKMALVEIKDPDRLLYTHEDISNYVQDNMNMKMPMDGPQWQLHFINGFIDPDDGVRKTLVLWKQHHSFCDGVSAMCM